jgi:hypothetical protein
MQQKVKKFDTNVYEQEKLKEKIIECIGCFKTFPLKNVEFQTSINKNEKDEDMKTTFFICPYCKKIYFVSIIDGKSKVYLKQINLLQCRIKRKAKMGIKQNASLKEDLNKAKSDFIAYQKFLMKKYESSFTLKKEF